MELLAAVMRSGFRISGPNSLAGIILLYPRPFTSPVSSPLSPTYPSAPRSG